MNRKFAFVLMLLAAAMAMQASAAVTTNGMSPAAAPATNNAPAAATKVASAPSPAAAKDDAKLDFQSFHLISERNIFDMSRTGRIGPRSAPKLVVVDDFSLVGVMSYQNGTYAFFDGSSSEYRQTLMAAHKIADFIISAIGPDYVELQATNGAKVKMPIGTMVRREDRGPWSAPTVRSDTMLADSGSSSRDSSDRSDRSDRSSRTDRRGRSDRSDRSLYQRNRTDSSTGDTGPATPDQKSDNSSNANESDIVKRLMEKRAKLTKDNE